ncbi:WD40 repeat-like protein [Pseudovirgaria hyperparasitica]|uniref:Mitochondrial division protein 1 n=1 Tax=Pseudovirgaria hyperparasitica TaxID=470096 RepID=A0A6A6VTP3_9PEZI|nr:WD40 repeat-like protein [Pseudovirgaria hyperparasitica]KAF2753583.1 WD40 repeat-like protein [Pseudovirgaria hyperparasitica]
MDRERSPKRKRSPDGLARFSTPERPPHSPISAQQSPGLQPRSFLAADVEEPQFDDVQAAYHQQHEELRQNEVYESRSPSVNGIQKSASPPRERQLGYKPKLILRGHKKGVAQVKYSPDGRWIASCSADASIKIWDSTTGSLLQTLEGHFAGISCIAWGPDSKTIASGSDDKSIRLWDVETGKPHKTAFTGHHSYVYSLSFSPKGNMLVSGSYDEAVFLWDLRTAKPMRSLPAHSDPVGAVDFVRDGTLITSCSSDGLIRVWDTATGQCLRTLVHEDNAPVTSVKFSPNGKYLLAWTLDSCMRLWNYVEGKGRCVKTYQGHLNRKYALSGCFGVYGTKPYESAFVASGSEDGRILLWDVSSKILLQSLEGHRGPVMSVDSHPAERAIASGGLDRTVRIWRSDEPIEQTFAHEQLADETSEEVPPDMRAEMAEMAEMEQAAQEDREQGSEQEMEVDG